MVHGVDAIRGFYIRVKLEDEFHFPDGVLRRPRRRQGMPDGRGRRSSPRERRDAARVARRPYMRGRMSALPLEGIRVLDLSRLLPGGFCSLLLADFGADVLKVEDTGVGDYLRWGAPYYGG
jgi:hypothetical protein